MKTKKQTSLRSKSTHPKKRAHTKSAPKTKAANEPRPGPDKPKPPPPPRTARPREDENADAARRRAEPSTIPITQPSQDPNEKTVGRSTTSDQTREKQIEHLKSLEQHHDVVRS